MYVVIIITNQIHPRLKWVHGQVCDHRTQLVSDVLKWGTSVGFVRTWRNFPESGNLKQCWSHFMNFSIKQNEVSQPNLENMDSEKCFIKQVKTIRLNKWWKYIFPFWCNLKVNKQKKSSYFPHRISDVHSNHYFSAIYLQMTFPASAWPVMTEWVLCVVIGQAGIFSKKSLEIYRNWPEAQVERLITFSTLFKIYLYFF